MNKEEEFDIFYVDMNRLEEQAAEHTFLFVQHSKDLKDAQEELNQIEAEIDLIKADIGHWVVKNPKKYKLPEKINAVMIERVILRHPKYKKELPRLYKAQKRVNTLKVYVAAYEHRKRMISKAADMYHDQYFAKPYIPSSEMREVVEQLEKQRIRRKSKPTRLKKKRNRE